MHEVTSFFDSFFEQIAKVGLDVSGLALDHLAFQASSAGDYEKRKSEFSTLGVLVSEEIIGGRRVGIFQLHKPIEYEMYSISMLELVEPREGQICESAFQHAEFVITKKFQDYIEQYPEIKWDTSSLDRPDFAHLKINFDNGLTLKFLKQPILQLVTKQ